MKMEADCFRWHHQLEIHCNVRPQPAEFQNQVSTWVRRGTCWRRHLHYKPTHRLNLGDHPESHLHAQSDGQLEGGACTVAPVSSPSSPAHVWIRHFWSNPQRLDCNSHFEILNVQRWANSVLTTEYEYEYYSVSQKWPNTNTNIIRFPKNDRIQIGIFFSYPEMTDCEYEYHSASQ